MKIFNKAETLISIILCSLFPQATLQILFHFTAIGVKCHVVGVKGLFVVHHRQFYRQTLIARTPMACLPWLIELVFESL